MDLLACFKYWWISCTGKGIHLTWLSTLIIATIITTTIKISSSGKWTFLFTHVASPNRTLQSCVFYRWNNRSTSPMLDNVYGSEDLSNRNKNQIFKFFHHYQSSTPNFCLQLYILTAVTDMHNDYCTASVVYYSANTWSSLMQSTKDRSKSRL